MGIERAAKLKNFRDDENYAWFTCPKCGLTGIIDKEQYEGKVSIDCPECDFHKTIDFRESEIDAI